MLANDAQIKSSLLEKVAASTPGFVGADLALLVRDVDRIRRLDLQLYR